MKDMTKDIVGIIKDLEKVEEYMINDGDYHDHSLIVRSAIVIIGKLEHPLQPYESIHGKLTGDVIDGVFQSSD